jgi:hypothetical protein
MDRKEKIKWFLGKMNEAQQQKVSMYFHLGYQLKLYYKAAQSDGKVSEYETFLADLKVSRNYANKIRRTYENLKEYRRLLNTNASVRTLANHSHDIRQYLTKNTSEATFWSTAGFQSNKDTSCFFQAFGKCYSMSDSELFYYFDIFNNIFHTATLEFIGDYCEMIFSGTYDQFIQWCLQKCTEKGIESSKYILGTIFPDQIGHCVVLSFIQSDGQCTYICFDPTSGKILDQSYMDAKKECAFHVWVKK